MENVTIYTGDDVKSMFIIPYHVANVQEDQDEKIDRENVQKRK